MTLRRKQTFTTLASLMSFLLNENKRLEKDETYGEVGGRMIFTDGSVVEITYSGAYTNDSGTNWGEEFSANYFEKEN